LRVFERAPRCPFYSAMIRRLTRGYVIPLITFIVNHVPSFIWLILEFCLDICFFWLRKLYELYIRKNPLREKLKQLKNVSNYNEWKATAAEIDKLTNMEVWRQNFILKHYDYLLINDRLKLLRQARLDGNSQLIMSLFRSGLIRNFGGILQKKLYIKLYMGTKTKIEEYISEVLCCLNFLNDSVTGRLARTAAHSYGHGSTSFGASGGRNAQLVQREFVMNSRQLKLDFFHDARQSFGCTALLLQGGSLFGLCHLGVVKALYFKGLLPRIIGGSAVGAAVASLVCTLTDHELIPILVAPATVMCNIDRLNHDVDERYGNVIENVVKKGYSQDILIFLKFVRDTIGDLTFEEAYLKTEKILNIVIHPTHQLIPHLLNYITAPNVIIWTAIYASIGTGVLSDNVQLYVKDFNNNIVPKLPGFEVKFLKPQEVNYLQQYFRDNHDDKKGGGGVGSGAFFNYHFKETLPYTRLTELFNVNHFVISLARPYLAPLISNDLQHYHNYSAVHYVTKQPVAPLGDAEAAAATAADVASAATTPKKPAANPSIVDSQTLTTKAHAAIEETAQDTNYNFRKHLKNIIGLEIQHRLEVLNKLGILSDFFKRLCIDEKPSTPHSLTSIREITIVPELLYLLKDFGRVFDVHKTMENIPYWVLVGEKLVWPLFPLLMTRCSIEFALDDLYNIHRKRG
jgi:TAG lipase/lysophosphatidylethanolamine acyltransferase